MFQPVKKKKAARRRILKDPHVGLNYPQENVNECVESIFRAKNVLQSSDGFIALKNNLHNVSTLLRTIDGEECEITSLVCYGLGSPSTNRSARYQTALLLTLRDHYNVDTDIYDPLFTSVDIAALEELKFHILENNEEGKRNVQRGTVFFMPHCGKELYNNLLWANWSPVSLPLCIIIGNSFSTIVQNIPSRILKEHYEFIYLAKGLFKEYPLETLVEYNDIFNDMSIHVISRDRLDQEESGFWCEKCEPKYENCDVEIVRAKANVVTTKVL